jgi:TRAP-type transport system periplasmic protein
MGKKVDIRSLSVILFLVGLIAAGCGPVAPLGASGNIPGKIILKLGTETPVDHPETKGAQRLADLMQEKSKGTVNIKVYENALIGTMKDRTEGMRAGTVDLSTFSVGFLAAYVPVLGIFDLPYIYQNKAQELRLFDGETGGIIKRKLKDQGFRVLCFFDMGARQITNNQHPIQELSDLKGMRIRVPQTEASIEGLRILGAVPTPMSFGEVYMALKQNVVTGQENPTSVVMYNKFYEVQKYLSLTEHQFFIQILCISEKAWKKLTVEQQQILLQCSQEAQSYERELAANAELELVGALAAKGMQVNTVADKTEFAEAAKPLRAIYIRRLGQEAKEMFDKIDAVR